MRPSCANDSGTTLAAWKESGGFAGTYSPNAAFAQGFCRMNGGTTYTVTLVWKANRQMPGGDVIQMGAGPLNGSFSTTTLMAVEEASPAAIPRASSSAQYVLNGSDGTTWQTVDLTHLTVTVTPSAPCLALLSANTDVWTQSAGYNQDLGISVTPAGRDARVVTWKESGGYAGTFSPNAAFVQGSYSMNAGEQYTVALVWKSNQAMPSGDDIEIGAGPTDGTFSPTSLAVDLDC